MSFLYRNRFLYYLRKFVDLYANMNGEKKKQMGTLIRHHYQLHTELSFLPIQKIIETLNFCNQCINSRDENGQVQAPFVGLPIQNFQLER